MPYTEGIYDDVNRALWLQWEWDAQLEAGRETRQVTFPVPRDASPFGHLDLEWIPAPSGGSGATAVSEVWLMRTV